MTHFPDVALAAAPASGWSSLESYGGGGYSQEGDFLLRAVIGSSHAEYDNSLLLSNVLGMPILARVGGSDPTVDPFELRQIVTEINSLSQTAMPDTHDSKLVQISEVPGMPHWWNGVLGDKVMEEFYAKHLPNAHPALPERFQFSTMNPATSGTR